jgi:hypothetical protein
MEELEAWKRSARPAFLYVGARRVMAGPNRFSADEVAAQPSRYIEVYRRGQAAVFRVAASAAEPLAACRPDHALTTGPT